ncbi:MAG TPA: TonB family protein [Thermoanaerobaculia bacterium]|nr:TonB family protein [Thermoanaerobaculia bacterium]
MSENILVVEYEPRYTDRVRQALAGHVLQPTFAKDGEEAMRALDGHHPRLIVLSSVVPKISTSELIRAIRGRKPLQETPILLTVSGYNGKSPKADAQRLGASDILPKPYSETEFLGKVQQMLGLRADAQHTPPQWAPDLDPDFTVRASAPPAGGQLTSNEIFGDILDDAPASPAGVRKTMAKPQDDLDKMLADTLSGVRPQKKKETPPAAPTPSAPPAGAPPAAAAKPKTQSGSTSFDKLLNDTLSGLEKTARKPTSPGTVPTPQVVAPEPAPRPVAPVTPPPVAAKPAAPPITPTPVAAPPNRYNTERLQALTPDRIPVSQPVFTPDAPRGEEEDTTDGTKFGQYVLVEKIATGGMAEVWKARMRGVEGFQKIVAIKKILPHLSDNQDFIEMFIDEAKLAAQLNHNNIIHIYDLGKIQSSYYIAMEYIDGFDLKTILRRATERDTPMTVELALFIASKIASALDYAHRKRDFEDRDMGIVHRDVSPQNVLISQEGDIKLCDFGIAKAASKASHTQAGALKGKLQYMSPEQAWGRNIDRRSDVFALATVLFEMLTARKLFTGDNELSILEQVREARVTAPSEFNDEVSPEIDRIVLKALQKDPANRYQTAGELARDLDAVLYSFRPTPTSADLAIYMHRLTSAEPVVHHIEEAPFAPPVVEAPKPIAIPAPAVVAPQAMAPAPAAAIATPSYGEEPKKKSPVALIAVAAVVVLAVIGAVFAMRGRGDAAPATAAATTTAPIAANTATTPVPATASSTIAPLTASTATTGSIDPNAVNAEVQKRLAAERARLELAARQQQAAAAAAQAAGRPAPVTATQAPAPQVAQQQPAPAPVQQQPEARPTPPPAPVQQPVQQAETTRDETPAPAPAAARVREGDLVPAGTEGLTPPHITRRGTVPYPPIARAQRVEGTVVASVLVSETGQVLEVRVLRGVNRPGGLNEAAVDTMKRSSFAPATKDGVRVKAWITIPIDFKL